MIPASLRVAILLSLSLTVIHLVVATSVAYQQPAEILGRQVRRFGQGGWRGGREREREEEGEKGREKREREEGREKRGEERERRREG